MDYLHVNWIEILGVLISLCYLYFSIRQIIWLWPLGLASALLYIVIYSRSGFYADMGLQVYYVIVSIYGWYYWIQGKSSSDNGTRNKTSVRVPVARVKKIDLIILTAAFLVLWVMLWWILTRFTNSTIPIGDAFTTAGGIIATWMLARKILENWLVWIIVDTVALLLYLWKGLYPTAFLFTVYTLMAIVGYRRWKRNLLT